MISTNPDYCKHGYYMPSNPCPTCTKSPQPALTNAQARALYPLLAEAGRIIKAFPPAKYPEGGAAAFLSLAQWKKILEEFGTP